MIQIIPAIDLMEGRCVRLTKGDYGQKKVYDGSPVDVARQYADAGASRIHLVDLDGAKAGEPRNLKVLEAISAAVSCELEWGGGIGSSEALQAVFAAGATHAIAGSVAALRPEVFESWLSRYGARMVLGADVRDGRIAVKGWLDGMLQGPSSELYRRLQSAFPQLSFTVSGGISSMEDIRQLDEMGLGKVIVGKALYEQRITLKDLKEWLQNA